MTFQCADTCPPRRSKRRSCSPSLTLKWRTAAFPASGGQRRFLWRLRQPSGASCLTMMPLAEATPSRSKPRAHSTLTTAGLVNERPKTRKARWGQDSWHTRSSRKGYQSEHSICLDVQHRRGREGV